ncbi:MAG: O-antigen ligase family protein [Pseudomonadota bacterium]
MKTAQITQREGTIDPGFLFLPIGLAAFAPIASVLTWWQGYADAHSALEASLRLVLMVEVVVVLLWLVPFRSQQGIRLPVPPIALAMSFALLAIGYSRIFVSPDWSGAIVIRTTGWLFHGLFLIALIDMLSSLRGHRLLSILALAMPLSGLAYVAMMAAEFSTLGPPSGALCTFESTGFGNVRWTGHVVAPAMIVFFFLASAREVGTPGRTAAFLAAACLSAFLFYTGTRAAWMSVAVTVIVMAPFLPIKRALSFGASMIAAAGVSAAVVYFLLPVPECGTYDMFRRVATGDAMESSGRVEVWLGSITHILEYPIFGRGPVPLSEVMDWPLMQLHNGLLQAAWDWGLVGAALFWLLIAPPALMLALSLRKAQPIAIASAAAFLSLLAYSMLDGILFHHFPVMFVLTYGAMAWVLCARSADATDTGSNGVLKAKMERWMKAKRPVQAPAE